MNKYFIFAAALFFTLVIPGSAYAGGNNRADCIVISFDRSVNTGEINSIAEAQGLKLKKYLKQINAYIYYIPQGNGTADFISDFRAKYRDKIRYAEPNYRVEKFYTPYAWPNDTYYLNSAPNDQWGLNIIQADRAWNEPAGSMYAFSMGDPDIKIAVIDSGLRATHEEIAAKALPGWNVIDGNTDTTDTDGHGTAVASIAAAATDNLVGIAGAAVYPKIVPVRITDISNNMDAVGITDAILWAADNGVSVMNLSVGGPALTSYESDACDYAYYVKGCLLVAATGNDGNTVPMYPAGFSVVLSVGSTNKSDAHSDFSNYGAVLKVSAPGGMDTPSQYIVRANYVSDSSYGGGIGTSDSCPFVAGLGAVLISNGIPNYEAVSRIAKTCDKVSVTYTPGYPYGSWNNTIGYGRVNFYRAMKTLVPPENLTVTDNTSSISLSWDPPLLTDTPTAGYNIFRATSASGPFYRLNASLLTSTNYNDTGVDCFDTTYYYYVRAVDSNNFRTRASNVVSTGVNCPGSTRTLTPTCSWTATPSYTTTPTFTRTCTSSVSATFTFTETFTVTMSFTTTQSPTLSLTPTPSWTASDTPFYSPTDTPTPSRTATDTPYYSPTSTPTMSATVPTQTATPMATATATATATFVTGGAIIISDQFPYPNPSLGENINFGYSIESGTADEVKITVYTAGFRKIAVITDSGKGPGFQHTYWAMNGRLSNGAFMYTLELKNAASTVKKTGIFVIVRHKY